MSGKGSELKVGPDLQSEALKLDMTNVRQGGERERERRKKKEEEREPKEALSLTSNTLMKGTTGARGARLGVTYSRDVK